MYAGEGTVGGGQQQRWTGYTTPNTPTTIGARGGVGKGQIEDEGRGPGRFPPEQ